MTVIQQLAASRIVQIQHSLPYDRNRIRFSCSRFLPDRFYYYYFVEEEVAKVWMQKKCSINLPPPLLAVLYSTV